MPNTPKFYLDPNFDPRSNVLPEIPEEIKTYKRKKFAQRRFVFILIGILGLALIAGFVIWNIKNTSNQYKYIKIISQYNPSVNDLSPGADIESIEIKINNLTYYAEKIAATSKDFSKQENNNYKDVNKLLGAPVTADNLDYVSLGGKNNYVVVQVKPDLRDPNITQFTINEITPNNLKEPYDVFIGTSKSGPWDYVGRQAGNANIIF